MPIQHAVLAMLEDGACHGYELRAQFKESVGPQWGDLNIGHLYQVLDRLVRDGLVTRRDVPQSARPDKYVYRLTKSGRAELRRWLETPFVRQGGYRDDFFLKLFAASRLGDTQLRTVLRVQREAYLGELAALATLRQEHGTEPLINLLIEAAIMHTEANLRIVEAAEKTAADLLSAPTTSAVESTSAHSAANK